MMSMYREVSRVVGKCTMNALWPGHSLGKTLVSLCPASFCTPRPNLPITPRYLLMSYFCIPVRCDEKDFFWWGSGVGCLVLEGLVALHRTVQTHLLQHYWLGHRHGLLWYWMACLGNEQRSFSFLRLHPSTAFWTLLLIMKATPFLLRDSCPQ